MLFRSYDLARYRLWVASYRDKAPVLPANWNAWLFWQYHIADDGDVPGIKSKVDLNYFSGPREQLFNINYRPLPTETLHLVYPLTITIHRVNQAFGARPEFYSKYGLRGHEGIDFYAPLLTPVVAAADGTISLALVNYGSNLYGRHVRIRHAVGGKFYTTVYAHLNDLTVALFQNVKAGDIIGHADSTGNSTASHLHFGLYGQTESGVRLNADNGFRGYIDPTPYMR